MQNHYLCDESYQPRTELCRFSGAKIYPGKGIRFIRADSQVLLRIPVVYFLQTIICGTKLNYAACPNQISGLPFRQLQVQALLPQSPQAGQAYMDSHVQEAAQEGLQMSSFLTAYIIVHPMSNHNIIYMI